jgi:hypothetical protein
MDFLKLGGTIFSFIEKDFIPNIWKVKIDFLHGYFVNKNGCSKMLKDKTAYEWYEHHIDDYITDRDDIINYTVYPDICIQKNDEAASSNLWADNGGRLIQQIIQGKNYEWWQLNSNRWAYWTRGLPTRIQRILHPYCLLCPLRHIF